MSGRKSDKQGGNFLTDLGRRGVYQAVGIYVAIAWGSTEILITASERFGWPHLLGNAALIVFLTGLPFVILLSWAFDLTGHGIKRMEPGSLKGKALIAAAFTLTLGISSVWFMSGPARDSGHAAPGFGDGRPVIAVMPFQDFIRDESSGLLTLSFADELINRINAHPDLVALSLSTVTSPLAGGPRAGQLPADFFVQAAFRPAQVGTELNVRLVDNSGAVQWEFETIRDLGDARQAHATQAWLAGEVASQMGVSLAGRDYCEPTDHPEALALYYGAREQFQKRGANNVAGAALKLERAIQLDPGFARAYDLLGQVYERFPRWVRSDPSQYGMTESELLAFWETRPYIGVLQRALDICPSLGGAYVTVALSAPVEHSLADLVDLVLEALRRDPGNTPLMDRVIYTYQSMGHLESALEWAHEYLKRDPLNARSSMLASMIYRAMGDSVRAMEYGREALNLSNAQEWEGIALAYDRLATGDFEALAAGLGDNFQPGPDTFLLDPRLIAEIDTNPEARPALLQQIESALETTQDPRNVYSEFLGAEGGPPWSFEMGDPELAWLLLERVAENAPPGFTPYGFWYHRHRHWFGNQRLVDTLNRWTDEYAMFWERHGPPDGCTWNGNKLDCAWAD